MSVKKIEAISYTRLTLALDIVRKIETGAYRGYHELGIIKHQVSLGDTIEVSESPKTEVSCAHPGVPEDERNICWRAVEMLREEFLISSSLRVCIDKRIPVEGGLAGGSTNAATVLSLANNIWELGLSREDLSSRGRELGMDVPFYFYGGTAFDSEAGGVIRPIDTDLDLHFVLFVPPFGVSTAAAYGALDYSAIGARTDSTTRMERALLAGDRGFANEIHNDFELSVFPAFPDLVGYREALLERGAQRVWMSGSGSTLVALVGDHGSAEELSSHFPGSMVVRSLHSI